MLRSLYAGISGMKANQVKLDVIGNNIANVGTTAFKSSRVRFQDMVSQSMSQALAPGANQGGINPKQVGLGVQVAGIDTMVGQGMMQPTSRNLDIALDGEGYLMVGKGLIPEDSTDPDVGGVVVNDDQTVGATNGMGLFYTRDGALTLDNEGNLLNSDGLRVLGYAITAVSTNADGSEGDTNTSLVYDSTIATGSKFVSTYADADSPTITTEKSLIPLVIPEKVNSINAAGDPITLRIRTFSIEKDGVIKAVLEDGSVSALGQIAMVSFKNPAGLEKIGGNIYQNTSNSGAAVIRTGKGAVDTNGDPVDNGKGYGDMLQGMLEMSNVDLAEQFTDMIIAQRAFQAAGKTITTGDEILQEIINLKR